MVVFPFILFTFSGLLYAHVSTKDLGSSTMDGQAKARGRDETAHIGVDMHDIVDLKPWNSKPNKPEEVLQAKGTLRVSKNKRCFVHLKSWSSKPSKPDQVLHSKGRVSKILASSKPFNGSIKQESWINMTSSRKAQPGLVSSNSSNMQLREAVKASREKAYAAKADPVSKVDSMCYKQYKQCYCKSVGRTQIAEPWVSVCGWCETTQRGMEGDSNGPSNSRTCEQWIFDPKDCGNLYCERHFQGLWYLWAVISVVLFFLALVAVRFFGLCGTNLEEVQCEAEIKLVKRTFEGFKQGLGGTKVKDCSRPFQAHASTSTTLRILQSLWKSTLLRHAMQQTLLFGFFVSVFFIFLKFSPLFLNPRQFNILSLSLHGTADAFKHLDMIQGFLFSFYILGRLGHWWNQLYMSRNVQGGCHGVALYVGSLLTAFPDWNAEKKWRVKWNTYRYLMLVFYLLFRPLSPIMERISLEDMVQLGFLEEGEKAILEKSFSNPRHTVMTWLSTQVKWIAKDQGMPQQFGPDLALITAQIEKLRGACGTLGDEYEVRAPWSFEVFLLLVVRLRILLTPLNDVNAKLLDREEVVHHIDVFSDTLGSMLVCVFYLSLLHLLEVFKDPFGFGYDRLDPENIFMETEGIVVDMLTSPLATSIEDLTKS